MRRRARSRIIRPQDSLVPQSDYSIHRVPYSSSCPFVGTGSPIPSLASECVPPPQWAPREEPTLACVVGDGGTQFRRKDRNSGTLCSYTIIPLYAWSSIKSFNTLCSMGCRKRESDVMSCHLCTHTQTHTFCTLINNMTDILCVDASIRQYTYPPPPGPPPPLP
jgi:hypothetical protein